MNNYILKIKSFLFSGFSFAKDVPAKILGKWSEISIFRKIVFGIGIMLIFIFPISAFVSHEISDDITYQSSPQLDTSPLVGNIVGLINREVLENGWVANKPFFFPQSIFLDNMPSYQKGVIYGLASAVSAIGKFTENQNIIEASKALAVDGEKWGFGKNNAARQYIEASYLLQENGKNIAMNEDLFMEIIDKTHYAIQTRFRETAKFLDSSSLFKTDNEFYFNKGALYSVYIVIRDAFNELSISEENNYLEVRTELLLRDLETVINYDPLIVISINNEPTMLTNHILVQNYYMAKISLVMKDILNRR